jgi:Stress up-regulated Nod 19
MGMIGRRRHFAFAAAICAVALLGAGCASLRGVYFGKVTLTTGTYRIGPFNLAPMDQPGSEDQNVRAGVPRPPGNIGIKAMRFDLVDASGNPVPRMDAHLHHILLMNSAHQSPICPGEEERFSGSGAERTPLSLFGSYAYITHSTDRWDALWHIMNMSDMAQTVYIQYQVDYVPATDPAAARPVTPFFMDVTGCGTNAEFNVPGNGGANSVYTRTRNITAPWDGVAVAAGGHLHDGGIDISIKRASTGEVGCTAVAHYDMPEPMDFPSSISPCGMHHLVSAGATYTLTARYDNSQPHTAVMGIMMAFVWHGVPPTG